MTSNLTYLTLDELEALAFKFADQGASILAEQGPAGPEWRLRLHIGGTEQTFRAHRVEVTA